jgi:ACT domain-containing protein
MESDAEVAEAIKRIHGGREGHQRVPHEVVNKQVKGTGSKEDLTVLIRGDNVFGTTVSKSFDRVNKLGNREVDTVNISIASYRVVEVRATRRGLSRFGFGWNSTNECRLYYI